MKRGVNMIPKYCLRQPAGHSPLRKNTQQGIKEGVGSYIRRGGKRSANIHKEVDSAPKAQGRGCGYIL